MRRPAPTGGFALLPVVLTMSIVAALMFVISRDNGLNRVAFTQTGDGERARYMAEAGLQAVNYVVQQAGCFGIFPSSTSPVTNASFEGGSYTAYSTTVTTAPLKLKLSSTGTYNGASVTLSRDTYVYKPRKTSTLQPGPGSGLDAHVNPNFPAKNYGSDTLLRLYTGNYQLLVRFNLSQFPAGTRVAPWVDTSGVLQPGAKLSLYQSQSGTAASPGTVVNAYAVVSDWQAASVTWNTYDGTAAWPSPAYLTSPVASVTFPNSVTWLDWDVTPALERWLGGVYPNYGFRLVESGGNVGDVYYNSSENSNPATRPKLVVSNVQPCGTIEPGTAEIQFDANIRSDIEANYGKSTLIDVTSTPGRRMLVKFDITGLPTTPAIRTAILRIYCRNTLSPTSQKKQVSAWYVMQSWTEGTSTGAGLTGVTWKTSDGANPWTNGGNIYLSWSVQGRDEMTNAQPAATFRQGWITFDITPAVQEWVDGGANNGMLVMSASSDLMQFDSREHLSPPELVVTY